MTLPWWAWAAIFAAFVLGVVSGVGFMTWWLYRNPGDRKDG